MTPTVALAITILAAFLAHHFTTKRFKNELKIKKEEKIINDAKELVRDFEKKLLGRIHLTRDYLYALKKAKHDNKELDDSLRKNYRAMIREWNLNFDYTATVTLRDKVLKNRNTFNILQGKLRSHHVFLAKNADNPQSVKHDKIDMQLKELELLQNECYLIMSNINNNIDDRWMSIFEHESITSRITSHIFDYVFKTLILYTAVNFILFFRELISL
ncbi:hypothetical protein WCU61_18320 [Pectobacterium versatile]|uniref:hypothetical protein n=1 Tax=Pectobacterium versatile TaxID=2488639 RepID=UPI001F353227|nr:hypothetical protein [Pectobacterium versatile]